MGNLQAAFNRIRAPRTEISREVTNDNLESARGGPSLRANLPKRSLHTDLTL